MKKKIAVVLVLALAGGCSGAGRFDPEVVEKRDSGTAANPMVQEGYVPPMDERRKVSEQDCSGPVDIAAGNLKCKGEPTAAERRAQEEAERQRQLAAERRARMEEAERQARAQREAEERAERERLERERAAQLAAEEAARKAQAAEEERLAAERMAREERERQEKLAVEARAAQLAEQQAREAAERERQRLEEEWLAGRALLEKFAATYGKNEKFKDVAEPINGFLDKTR
ncbi:hypothetical protein AYO46_09975 [Betaproteobacteria bacterium SCGC AG-212-J23]|nr:hypothetical protein AYO46_09975 [Betaproteobacteria bacterium SCGC AG-212-J23]